MAKIDPNIKADIRKIDALIQKQRDVLHFLSDHLWFYVESILEKEDIEMLEELKAILGSYGYTQMMTGIRLKGLKGKFR